MPRRSSRGPLLSLAGGALLSFACAVAQAQTPPSAAEIAAYTGLHAAAASGNVGEIDLLARQGDNLNARDANGRSVGLVGSLDDVAAVTQSDDSATRAATILESSSDAVFSITDDSRVWFLNGAAEDLFGDADIGEPTVQALFTSESLRRFEGEIIAQVDADGAWNGELTMRGRGGTPIAASAGG